MKKYYEDYENMERKYNNKEEKFCYEITKKNGKIKKIGRNY